MSEYIYNLRTRAEHSFKDHTAEVVLHTDVCSIVDWKNKNGSGDYAVRYIFDTQKGNIIITGDLGDAIFSWYGPQSVERLVRLSKDPSYFVSKAQTASDLYTFECEDVMKDLEEACRDAVEGKEETWDEECQEKLNGLLELIDDGGYSVNDSHIRFDSQTDGYLDWFDTEWYEDPSFYHAGKRVAPRVILWMEGLKMMWEQTKNILKENEKEKIA